MEDLYLLYFASLFTFAFYGWDKHLSVYHCRRVPELVLLLFAFLFGAFGALCAMILFKHKTKHFKFIVCVPIFLFLQLALDIVVRML